MQLIQLGTAFYLLASASGLALRPHTRALTPSSRHNTSLVSQAFRQNLKGSIGNVSLGLVNLAVTPAQNSQGLWTTAQCDQNSIDDATVDFADRWAAADVSGAWNDMLNEWNSGSQNNLYRGLAFSQFASYYFQGPDQWNCQDIGSVPCSTTVQCKDVNHPAGYGFCHQLLPDIVTVVLTAE
ncbi:hypothetical protein N7457_002465 [Penicillium paradoxum]|uniref:uncharacterized protein n=1 Tax=Penicillium paradoxum TaxID=176176 RepID=UPI002548CB4E|nr:uncharacterized protein N7457_002465 [Penicillium paradoxum]KAJ5787475.1 hypothetical protein N7457_002465 [Penicillium paradoxum]